MKTKNSHGLLQLHVGREALAYCQCASALISGNKALFVSVDLIGEKDQVILEYIIFHSFHLQASVRLSKEIQLEFDMKRIYYDILSIDGYFELKFE